jgi:DNA primase
MTTLTPFIQTVLIDNAAILGNGEVTRMVCPFCGNDKELSFAVGRDKETGRVWFKCHRASCEARGTIGVGVALSKFNKRENLKVPEKAEPTRLETEVSNITVLPTHIRNYLRARYNWNYLDFGVAQAKWLPTMKRVAFPIFSPRGEVRGYSLRSYEKSDRKQAKTYTVYTDKERKSKLSFYFFDGVCNDLMVVEDIPSAVTASRYCHAVALQGTTLTDSNIEEIASLPANYAVIYALDKDATNRAVEMFKKFRLRFHDSRMAILKKDIKDMNTRELNEFFELNLDK